MTAFLGVKKRRDGFFSHEMCGSGGDEMCFFFFFSMCAIPDKANTLRLVAKPIVGVSVYRCLRVV